MKKLVDDYKCEALLERLVGRCKDGQVSWFEWLVEMMVDYGVHIIKGHVLEELRVGQ